MYIVIRIILQVCLYIHKCHMPINPYFFCTLKYLAQRLLFVSQQDTSTSTSTRHADSEYTYINWEDRIFAI